MYYNGSGFIYNRSGVSKVEQVEYAKIEHLTAFAARLEDLEVREGKIVNQIARDKKNIEEAFEQIRYNYQAVQDLRLRVKELEEASSAAKRKRRVTVCAGDQKVEVIKL